MHLETIIDVEGSPAVLWHLLSRLGDEGLRAEGLTGRYQATLVITDGEGIRAVNREQRRIDRETDVLSFPSVRYPSGTARDHQRRFLRELDVETGCMHLGDIVVSLPRAREQAAEYGHSQVREIGFLFVHGLLHLLGYDHEKELERRAMRAMEEMIMDTAGLSRTLTDEDAALLASAQEAVKRAYAPYSGYRVGACVRAADGRVFRGCNVENASFGMTICAERNALTTAITEGASQFTAIAIAGDGPSMPYPCGACRQFLREFATDMKVLLTNGQTIRETTLAALLPESFGPESLHEVQV